MIGSHKKKNKEYVGDGEFTNQLLGSTEKRTGLSVQNGV